MDIRIVENSKMRAAWDLNARAFQDSFGRAPTELEATDNFPVYTRGDHVIGAYDDDKNGVLVGMVIIRSQKRCSIITNLYVLPDYREKGVGRALLEFALEHLEQPQTPKPFQLLANRENQGAMKLYNDLGFRETYRWDNGIVHMERRDNWNAPKMPPPSPEHDH